MRILIVEDDTTCRSFLLHFLSKYGECDDVVNGLEALKAFFISIRDNKLYDLVCLDIMMPKVDGVDALKAMRDLEKQKGIPLDKQAKVIITSALDDKEFVKKAFEIGCDGFVSKPINTERLAEELKNIGLIKNVEHVY